MQLSLTASPKNVIALSVGCLLLAGIFGFLNAHKVKTLHADVAAADAARNAVEQKRAAEQKEIRGKEAAAAEAMAKAAERETKMEKVEAEFVQVQKDKADLQTKVQANETQIADLQKRIEEFTGKPGEPNPGAASPAELQAQLEEARKLLDSAEREKAFLSDKLRTIQERSSQLEQENKRRASGAARLGVRGTVLAVNQAYNFVVLNLGGRNGVEANSEMLVLRGGTLIGKIRISSVEPSTAIGDILTSSLARGVQIQPGDIVIYAGSNS